ncbi:hypothetical protein FQA39_LY08183 [Lamprigera yunnana]|nr:hypothetical protein FQA39_LY08183 [Lamprigera yunnana]
MDLSVDVTFRMHVAHLQLRFHVGIGVYWSWFGFLVMQALVFMELQLPDDIENADRVKPEEWPPILNALCLDTNLCFISIKSESTADTFYPDIDTEAKFRKFKRQNSGIRTDYILKSLIKSLGCCIKNSRVISCLELDGLLLPIQYLELLLQHVKYNRTIKVLSLKQCPINDHGCRTICTNLRLMPNIEVINLSSCNLSTLSGLYVGKIINQQQLSRNSGSWNTVVSLETPQKILNGLRRISLDNNPKIRDDGLGYILNALDDDTSIKALDMRNCGITERMSNRLLKLIEKKSVLEVFDFRDNIDLSTTTTDRIYEMLQNKDTCGEKPEFEWDVITIAIDPN